MPGCGFALKQLSVAWDTTMQEHVPGEMLARVYSYDMLALPQGGGAAPRPPARRGHPHHAESERSAEVCRRPVMVILIGAQPRR
jgi:hypothetical protein